MDKCGEALHLSAEPVTNRVIEENAVTSPDENVTDFYDNTINTTNTTTNTTADEYHPNEENVNDSLEFSAGQAIFSALEVLNDYDY